MSFDGAKTAWQQSSEVGKHATWWGAGYGLANVITAVFFWVVAHQ